MKMILIFFLVLLMACFIFFGKTELITPTPPLRLKIGQSIVEVEIADTPAERERGLSDRGPLCENCGLLFLFDQPGVYPFWMKRMRFDIDILWVRNGEVVNITYGAQKPPKEEFETPKTFYQSRIPIDSALEVNAGWVNENRVKIGDRVEKLR